MPCKQALPFPCILHFIWIVTCAPYMFSHTYLLTRYKKSVKVHDASTAHLPTRLHLTIRCSSHFPSVFTSLSTYWAQSASVTCHAVWLECHFLSGDIWVIIVGNNSIYHRHSRVFSLQPCSNLCRAQFSCHSSISQIKPTTEKGQAQNCVIVITWFCNEVNGHTCKSIYFLWELSRRSST